MVDAVLEAQSLQRRKVVIRLFHGLNEESFTSLNFCAKCFPYFRIAVGAFFAEKNEKQMISVDHPYIARCFPEKHVVRI